MCMSKSPSEQSVSEPCLLLFSALYCLVARRISTPQYVCTQGAVECPQPQGCLYMCCICVVYCILCMCLCVFVYLSESLLGGSPPLSMYALEGAVECPHTHG